MGLLDGKGQTVRYAAPGENVQIFLNIANEDAVKRGDVLCNRDTMMPVTDLFEAEMDILDLLDYKPLMTKGYTADTAIDKVYEVYGKSKCVMAILDAMIVDKQAHIERF